MLLGIPTDRLRRLKVQQVPNHRHRNARRPSDSRT